MPVSFTCRPVLLQGLCRSASSAGLFYYKACAGQLHLPACFCYNGLVLPCHALSACLYLDPMPAGPSLHLPPFITMCARIIARAAGTALKAAAPWDCTGSLCTVLAIHPSIYSVACVCLRQCPFSVLQGLPCRQPHTETAFVQPVHRFMFTAPIQGGVHYLCA